MSGRLAFMPKSVLGRLTVFFRSKGSDCMGTYYYRIGAVGRVLTNAFADG